MLSKIIISSSSQSDSVLFLSSIRNTLTARAVISRLKFRALLRTGQNRLGLRSVRQHVHSYQSCARTTIRSEFSLDSCENYTKRQNQSNCHSTVTIGKSSQSSSLSHVSRSCCKELKDGAINNISSAYKSMLKQQCFR